MMWLICSLISFLLIIFSLFIFVRFNIESFIYIFKRNIGQMIGISLMIGALFELIYKLIK